jgi:Acyltransferase
MVRSVLVYVTLLVLKTLSRIFYKPDFAWVGEVPRDPWKNIRLIAFLNHTSLFEPVFLAGVPNSFCWRLARHGVVPAATKTTDRPLVGMLFKLVAHHVVPVTRERDHTWYAVLEKIDPRSMIVIAPEGRMKRANGLDANGQPMSVRGGIADILEAMGKGRMLIAYSGGLHHVQIPGRMPSVFETVRMRLEDVDIATYIEEMKKQGGEDNFKRSVREDLDRRRDRHCPVQERPPAPRTAGSRPQSEGGE